jgi:hypothetical protein
MSTDWRNNPDECYGQSVFGYTPQKNVGIKVNKPTIRKLRDADRDAVLDPINPDTLIGPVEINEHDVPEPTEYNPFRYVYPIIIDELNMEIVVRFQLSDLDHANLDPVTFTDKDGVEHTIPFFPTVQDGKIPVQETYEGEGDLWNFYREGERELSIIPVIERAKIFGDGVKTSDVLISRSLLEDTLSPERFMQALLDWREDLRADPAAPRALYQLACEIAGDNSWRGSESYDDDYYDDDDWD